MPFILLSTFVYLKSDVKPVMVGLQPSSVVSPRVSSQDVASDIKL